MHFIFDLDGTICFKGKPLSPAITRALHQLEEAGHRIVFASARPIRDMLPVLPKPFHSGTLIGGNGALISENGNITFSRAFSPTNVETLMSTLHEHQATYLIDGEGDYSYTGRTDHPILTNLDPHRLAKNIPVSDHLSIVKLLILSATEKESLLKKLGEMDLVLHLHAQEDVIDCSPKGIHKRAALSHLNTTDYIAFGNDANDITMFKGARHAVMIGDHQALRPHCTESIPYTTEIEEDIIAKLMELSDAFASERVTS
ncbi:HAD-IIB family hydrolase [Rossellomorea marisflavi]|uniref:HAD-IIB family hydrolase n=1 Tax=Rossellomorea marisflavi TaxID=189381 RepID=UPI0040445AB0